MNSIFFDTSKFSFMLKLLSIFLFILISSSISFAQNTLVVDGVSPKLFLNHKVSPKENFYSVSRKYNVPPKDIAAYNNLQFEKGLNVGETIKIPLTENNFSQDEASVAGKNLIPVYHIVLPKEGLYRISITYNKVPLTSIKKWNHLQSDEVSIGSSLIIGFLKANKPGMDVAEVPKNDASPQPTNTDASHEKSVQITATDEKPVKKDDVVSSTEDTKTTTVNAKSSINFSGGYFKKLYDDQSAKKTTINDGGNAGVFKSTSGWQDGKYYCFSNGVPPGTVIKITSSTTNKSVYAKVLDAIPDIKQNARVTIIVSNAAAEELGAGDKFVSILSYAK
jgi:LysM repeat protein